MTKPFLLLVFHDQGMCPEPDPARLELAFREKGHADLPVLNPMAAMLNETGTWRVDARWGRVQAFSNGWIYSPWFGYLNVKELPIVQHHILGPLLYIGSGTGDLWLYKEGLGKFFYLRSGVSQPLRERTQGLGLTCWIPIGPTAPCDWRTGSKCCSPTGRCPSAARVAGGLTSGLPLPGPSDSKASDTRKRRCPPKNHRLPRPRRRPKPPLSRPPRRPAAGVRGGWCSGFWPRWCSCS